MAVPLKLLGVTRDDEGNITINAATPAGSVRPIPLTRDEALILISRLAKILVHPESRRAL